MNGPVDPLATLRRRAFRHAFEDGAADIVFGVYALMVGGATQRRGLLALAVVYLAVMRLAWRFLHHQVSSRRTGYAELPGDPPAGMLSVILSAGVLTLAVAAGATLAGGQLWGLEHWPAWTPVLAGLALAAGLAHTAVRSGLVRYHALAGFTLASAVFFWLCPFGPRINPSDRLTLSLFVTAAALLLSGATAMARFVRAHPAVAEAEGHAR